jgi:hypothetical protein
MRDEPNNISLRRATPVEIAEGGASSRSQGKRGAPSPRITLFRVGALALLMSDAIPIILCATQPERFKVPVLVYGFALLLVGMAGCGLGGRLGVVLLVLIWHLAPWMTVRWYFVLMLTGLICLVGVYLVLNRV